MGIFDKLFRGPELSKQDAEIFSLDIALKLFTNEMTIDEFISNMENVIEGIFQSHYPDNSITPDQTKQIVRTGLILFENEKEYLQRVKWDRDYTAETGYFRHRSGKPYRPDCYRGLTLFKDKYD